MPEADRKRLQDTMRLYQSALHKTIPQTIRATAGYIGRSLAASTKISAKLRPIVKNPDERYKTDARFAPFGVMHYPRGVKTFKPIYRTGEYGRIRFFDKKSFSWMEKTGPESNVWHKMPSGPDVANPELIGPGIMTDKRRIIGRRGLAKASWRYLGTGRWSNVSGLVAQAVTALNQREDHTREVNPSIVLHNRIGYATSAFRNKWNTVDTAMARAAGAMQHEIMRKLTGIRLK